MRKHGQTKLVAQSSAVETMRSLNRSLLAALRPLWLLFIEASNFLGHWFGFHQFTARPQRGKYCYTSAGYALVLLSRHLRRIPLARVGVSADDYLLSVNGDVALALKT